MAGVEYEFTNEESIDRDLECVICSRPFDDPHRTHCGHTYCKKCITDCIARNIKCPLCRQSIRLTDLKKAEATSNKVNRLLVTCKKCGQSDIHRDEFNDHIRNDCPKTPCTIKNLQQIELLINQPTRQIQRLRKELERQKTDINNNNTEMNNTLKTIHEKLQKQQDEIQTLRQSNDIQKNRIQELQHKVQTQEEQIQEQEESIVQLERDNRRLYENSNESKTQIRNLEEKMKRQLTRKIN
jgi:chromosome segregation ATPase